MTDCILVVDDDPTSRLVVRRHLTSAGFEVEEASDGQAGLQRVREEPKRYRAVLLDQSMPELTGLELLQELQDLDPLERPPIIFQTAADDPEQQARSIESGAAFYLIKPVERTLLLTVVESALRSRGSMDALNQAFEDHRGAWSCLRSAEFTVKTPSEARAVAASAAQMFPTPRKVATGMLELLMNGIEHGNLEIGHALKGSLLAEQRLHAEVERRLSQPPYQDRQVKLSVCREPDQVWVRVQDDGPGFDFEAALAADPVAVRTPHGRGLLVAQRLCFDALRFEGRGNVVVASVGMAATAG